jgi:hypothetical protein
MLPGFRFLFTAIVLSMSVLVFGLGAAALLRAAHEQFASTPSWHVAPEAGFAQQTEAERPVLSMLRVEGPTHTDQQPSDIVPTTSALAIPDSTEQAAIQTPPHELERVAALQPQPTLDLPAKSDTPVSENPPEETTSAHDDASAAQTTSVVTADSAGETRIASIGQGAPELPADSETMPVATEADPAASRQSGEPDSPKLQIAKLDSSFVAVDTKPSAKAPNAKLDPSVIRRRLRARRAALRRRLAAERARLAQFAAQTAPEAAQQVANPFVPPFAPPPALLPALLPAPPRNVPGPVPMNQNRGSARPL